MQQGSHISWTPLEDLQQWSHTLAPPTESKPPVANESERPRSCVSPEGTYVPVEIEITNRKPKRKHKKRSIFLAILTVMYDWRALKIDAKSENPLWALTRASFETKELTCRVFLKHHTRSCRRCSGGKQVTTSKQAAACISVSISTSASTSTASEIQWDCHFQ